MFATGTPSLVIKQELEVSLMVHRCISWVAKAPFALHWVETPDRMASTTRSFVVPTRAINKLSNPEAEFNSLPRRKSIIRSQSSAPPKFASKSIVIPLLNCPVLMSGRSMKGPFALSPPGNFQEPDEKSMSKLLATVALRVAWLLRPERSLTVVVVPNEFKSEEL